MLTYLIFIVGSLLFIFVGGLLLFAPEKFIAAGRWWGSKTGFSEAHYQGRTDRSFMWRNWRLPGLYGFCFGLVMLLVILRSLIREEHRAFPTARTPSVATQNQAPWYALAVDVIPIALGIFILLRTEQILARLKNIPAEQANAEDGLNPARYLFKAIGSLAIIAGLAFLMKHLLSLA